MTARQAEVQRRPSVRPPAGLVRHPKRRGRSSTRKRLEQLFVAFWDLGLENIPEGAFIHRIVPAKEAKRLIDKARKEGTLRCASHEDLLAPYKKKESADHEKLCRVLRERFEIALSLRDFLIRHEDDGRKTYTICPLAFAEVRGSSSLMIVNCHYVMAARQKGKVRFDVEPDSVSFHLLEAGRPH